MEESELLFLFKILI